MSSTPTTAVLEIIRTFNAPRQVVFDAFTTFDVIKTWFGPEKCQVQSGTMDFKVGGEYRFNMLTPGGLMTVAGHYTDITPPEKIAFTWRWLEDEDWTPLHSQITIEFREQGATTEMRFVQIGFPNEESRNNHEHGWCGSFDKLGARC